MPYWVHVRSHDGITMHCSNICCYSIISHLRMSSFVQAQSRINFQRHTCKVIASRRQREAGFEVECPLISTYFPGFKSIGCLILCNFSCLIFHWLRFVISNEPKKVSIPHIFTETSHISKALYSLENTGRWTKSRNLAVLFKFVII